jgi:hypothetical protein
MATLHLMDSGRTPRRHLQYSWRPGQREQLTLDLRTSASASADGTDASPKEFPLPPILIQIAVEPGSVSPEGDLHYAWHVTSATAGANMSDAGIQPQILAGVRAQLLPLQHLSGSGTVTNQGISREVMVDPASLGDGGTGSEMVLQVVQTLRDVAAPLPREEVGLGARWQKFSRIDSDDAHVAQTETFTLTALDGESGDLDDLLAQTASPQAIPGASRSRGPRMDSMLTSGVSKMHFSTTRLVPHMSFEGTAEMVAAHTTITTHMKIDLSGATGVSH